MLKLAIDGSKLSGHYRVDCECGEHWSGVGDQVDRNVVSPALPIAECVAHMRLAHPQLEPDIRFSARFSDWLIQYWERSSLRETLKVS